MTANELMNKGLWHRFCILEGVGINPWAVNEGQIAGEHEFEVPLFLVDKDDILKALEAEDV